MDLTIEAVAKRFGAVEALRGVDLAVEDAEFFAILGPSGAGKTTLLRIIAGIERADSGRVLLGGRDIAEIPVRARNTAMVFQTFALYPHHDDVRQPGLSVARGGRRPRGNSPPGRARSRRCCGCRTRSTRKPGTLSGGEQQRCAIGRALIRRPRILLLDEPLTNLDAKFRHDTRAEFKRLHRELGKTTMIYATPDQLEALSMGRRIGVLRHGVIVQVGTPDDVYAAPGSDFVATLVGDPPINLVPATLRQNPGGQALDLPFTSVDASPWRGDLRGFPAGSKLLVGLRPQGDLAAARRGGAAALRSPRVSHRTAGRCDNPRSSRTEDGSGLKMVLPQDQAYRLAVDDAIECEIDTSQLCLFAQETGTAIRRDGAQAADG